MNNYLIGAIGVVTVVTAGATVEAVRHQYGQPLVPHFLTNNVTTATPSSLPAPVVTMPVTSSVGVSATVLPVFSVSKLNVTQKPEQRTDLIQLQTTNGGTTPQSAQIVVTFYNAAGKPIGSASTITAPIAPNATQASAFYTSDLIDSYASVKAFVSVAQ